MKPEHYVSIVLVAVALLVVVAFLIAIIVELRRTYMRLITILGAVGETIEKTDGLDRVVGGIASDLAGSLRDRAKIPEYLVGLGAEADDFSYPLAALCELPGAAPFRRGRLRRNTGGGAGHICFPGCALQLCGQPLPRPSSSPHYARRSWNEVCIYGEHACLPALCRSHPLVPA